MTEELLLAGLLSGVALVFIVIAVSVVLCRRCSSRNLNTHFGEVSETSGPVNPVHHTKRPSITYSGAFLRTPPRLQRKIVWVTSSSKYVLDPVKRSRGKERVAIRQVSLISLEGYSKSASSPEIPDQRLSLHRTQNNGSQRGYIRHSSSRLSRNSQVTDEMCDRSVVLAIDFGTAFSGYAFSFKSDPNRIYTNDNWKGNYVSLKTPTSILLDSNSKLKAFGYEAEEMYSELLLNESDSGWSLFRKFKMNLYKDEDPDNLMITDEKGLTKLPAITVFEIAIGFLKENAIKKARVSKRQGEGRIDCFNSSCDLE